MHFSPFCIHWRRKLRNLLNRAKNIYIYLRYCVCFTSNGGQWQRCRQQTQRLLVRLPPVFFSLPRHSAPSVKLRILQNFTVYLRNSWSINLPAIENCICGLHSIERKMRSILRTVCLFIKAHILQSQTSYNLPARERDELQRQNTKNLKQIFPEKELRGYSPSSQIQDSVSDLYIPLIGLPILLQENRWTECGKIQIAHTVKKAFLFQLPDIKFPY